jgi:hypothetical protein
MTSSGPDAEKRQGSGHFGLLEARSHMSKARNDRPVIALDRALVQSRNFVGLYPQFFPLPFAARTWSESTRKCLTNTCGQERVTKNKVVFISVDAIFLSAHHSHRARRSGKAQ